MAGHSKWANIKHRKDRMDAKRGRAFSQAVKEITVAAKAGGSDPGANPRLRLALQKGKDINLPQDNIEKAIKRGAGLLEGVAYEEVRYEGYGPEGVAVIADCLTDNRRRTTADVRKAFNKNNGNLGTDGSVSYMFSRVGQILYAPGCDRSRIEEVAIEAGASDLIADDDGSLEVTTEAGDFMSVLDALRDAGCDPAAADLVMQPSSTVPVADAQAERVRKMLAALEDCDDIQQVHSNAAFED